MSRSDPSLLPEPIRQRVEAELRPGEGVRWVEQPIPGRVAWTALPTFLFAIPWTAFALFWTWGAWGATCGGKLTPEARMFPLFGIPFVLVGLGLFSSPLWLMLGAKRTVYLVTDRRAVVIRGGWAGNVTVRSFEPEKLMDLRRDQREDGSGDLVFGQDVKVGSKGREYTVDYGFIAVPNAREAEEYVRALAHHAPPV
jgi:hypothetical protein